MSGTTLLIVTAIVPAKDGEQAKGCGACVSYMRSRFTPLQEASVGKIDGVVQLNQLGMGKVDPHENLPVELEAMRWFPLIALVNTADFKRFCATGKGSVRFSVYNGEPVSDVVGPDGHKKWKPNNQSMATEKILEWAQISSISIGGKKLELSPSPEVYNLRAFQRKQ